MARRFEKLGELVVYDNIRQGSGYNDEEKRQAALRWLSEQARSRRKREVRTLQVLYWTFIAAISAVLLGVISFLISIAHWPHLAVFLHLGRSRNNPRGCPPRQPSKPVVTCILVLRARRLSS
jgi:hypothetical protein